MTEYFSRERTAAHEAGHAVAAFLLGRVNVLVSLDGPFGGPVSVDRHPPDYLGGKRRPAAHWYEAETDVVITLAGPLSEHLGDEPAPVYAAVMTTWRAPEPEPRTEPAPTVPIPVAFQDADEQPRWPRVPLTDHQQVEVHLAAITTSDEERDALRTALTCRTDALTAHPHFRALHAHLTRVLLHAGEVHGPSIRTELQRAELHYTTHTIEEPTDGPQVPDVQ